MAQMTAQDLFTKGVAAFQSGDMDQAEAHFRAVVTIQPQLGPAHLNLGVILLNRGAYAEAEPFLQQAVTRLPGTDSMTAYAGLMDATGRPAEAEQWYGTILKSTPNHPPTLRRLAELHERHANRRVARASYKRAFDADPTDLPAGMGYARTSLVDDAKEAADVLERLLAGLKDDNAHRLTVLGELLVHKEWYERIQRGLPPQHGTSLSDLFFPFCAPELQRYHNLSSTAAAANPNDSAALIRKFTALFCVGNRTAAQDCLARFQPFMRGNLWETVTFDPAFYRQLETTNDTDIVAGLPPLKMVSSQTFSAQPIIYLSCNQAYFTAFAVPLIRSLADRSPGAQLHVHVMDATDGQLQEMMAFREQIPAVTMAISSEQPWINKHGMAAARAYYHAIRFVRFYQHLQLYNRSLWLMDVDALINADPTPMFETLDDRDVALRIRPGRLEPWNQFNASVVGAKPDTTTYEYFRLIAAYIAHFYRRDQLRWGIDQLAMYGVFEYLRDVGREPTLAFLNDRAVDYAYLDDGIVWCNSGKNKFAHLNRKPDGSLMVDDPDRAKYLHLFDKYSLVNADKNRQE